MDNGGVFFLTIIAFFFVLWIAGGGPSRQISFSGPYITPITNEGETQSGYGPKLKVGGTISLPGASLTASEKNSTQTIPNASSYAGMITISHTTSTDSSYGYVVVTASKSAGKDIDVTGWKVKSVDTGLSATIPTAVLVLRLGTNNTLQDVVLRPGDKASVTTAVSAANTSFESNECTGYLSSQQSLYSPCVIDHINDPGFLTGTWYVYLGSNDELWKASGDTIELLDPSGKVAATAQY